MSFNKCCEVGSLASIIAAAFGHALNILPPLAALIASSLGAYYYFLQIRKEQRLKE